MAEPNNAPSAATSSQFKLRFNTMSDTQLTQAISQLSSAAASASTTGYQPQGYAAPTPQRLTTYQNNINKWSASATPPPRTSSRRSKPAKSSNLAPTPAAPPTPAPAPARVATPQRPPAPTPTQPPAHAYAQPAYRPPPAQPTPARAAPALHPTPQALHSTYASRLRTGATLLMQPVLAHAPAAAAVASRSRRAAVVSYAEPASGEEDEDIPDAGEVESDGSDFVASGGTRSAIRPTRSGRAGAMQVQAGGGGELDQSYLGMVPPARFIVPKPVAPTRHEAYSQERLETQAALPAALVPIRVEFETETHRIRDVFTWNVHETLVTPEQFARTFVADLELPAVPWAETVATQIRAQLEDAEAVGGMDMAVDGGGPAPGDEVPECRVVLSIDVQIDNHHLTDHIEWDLRSTLTPEAFTAQLCTDLGLSGEAHTLIAHALHEELLRHKKDALEWGVIGGPAAPAPGAEEEEQKRDKSGLSLLKDKTGLGLGWGRAPKDGRGPRVLRSVWRDWQEAEEFGTHWGVMSAEEVERREIERERSSRRLRRETSKFQTSARTRRR